MTDHRARVAKTVKTRECPNCHVSITGAALSFGTHVKWCGVDEVAMFWSKVDKNGPGGCWLWTSYCNERGYGLMRHKGRKNFRAHRFSWELVHGPTPSDRFCLHKCDVRRCVNPDHMFLGSYQENMDDMVSKGRQRNGKERLTPAQVLEIRANPPSKYNTGKWVGARQEMEEYAKKYGVSPCTIGHILSGRCWKRLLPSKNATRTK